MKKIVELEYVDVDENKEYEEILSQVAEVCFKEEKIDDSQFYISIILTNDTNIRNYNNQYRNIDKSTDVLSFPMFEQEELEEKIKEKNEYQDILGDVIISLETVARQAVEYGHSFKRELAYMLVHSFYHLLGYDHMVEEDKKKMREKEENILEKMNIQR